eukprot:CAMPEP_0202760320 /NCGR_PEP_ID=MMETSP1388-20130828/18293_1 /ASSEMBLY_ACC=CAM_ASM_000864 /TAXON_ID=37098 /ORGANISM="Isochrysis sp, Strain CCMP1244" /LENGTH=44 /DNA_ID= /DNA_START= /DNA_END= /DNA_ORIENTATION=
MTDLRERAVMGEPAHSCQQPPRGRLDSGGATLGCLSAVSRLSLG